MAWQDIADAPRNGTWVWGEWPAIVSDTGVVRSPRRVEPMVWGKADGFVAHWLMHGRPTMGDGPARFAEMGQPPAETEPTKSAYGPGETIMRAWVIVREPGCIPQVKVPHPQSADGVDAMLGELVGAVPEAHLSVVAYTNGGDLWVEDGAQRLEIALAMKGVPYHGGDTHAD